MKLIMKAIYIICFFPLVSHGASLTCDGIPKDIFIQMTQGDLLTISIENSSGEQEGPWNICRMDAEVSGISVDRCKAIHANSLSAMMAGKKISIIFNDNSNYTSCGSILPWSTETVSNIKSIRIMR